MAAIQHQPSRTAIPHIAGRSAWPRRKNKCIRRAAGSNFSDRKPPSTETHCAYIFHMFSVVYVHAPRSFRQHSRRQEPNARPATLAGTMTTHKPPLACIGFERGDVDGCMDDRSLKTGLSSFQGVIILPKCWLCDKGWAAQTKNTTPIRGVRIREPSGHDSRKWRTRAGANR